MPSVKLLIVEDEEIVALDIETTLKYLGYDVCAVIATGEEAIACAATLSPNLVLMDIMLKGNLDGIQAAAEIYTRFNIPVVYLTAYRDNSTVARAKNTEPFGYLTKPFEEKELHTTIEIALSRHEAEQRVRQALEKEKELSQLKSLFVANASHEFRTPLATIRSSLDLLERYSKDSMDEKKLRHFQRIQTAIDQMLQLLDNLLIIGQGDVNKLEFNPLPLNLVEFCESLIEEFQINTLNQYSVNLEYNSNLVACDTLERLQLKTTDFQNSVVLNTAKIASETPRVIVFNHKGNCTNASMDENLLRQILSNLLSNAIKYSPPQEVVRFELICEEQSVTFRIQDRGIGIPLEDQQRLFEPFYRGDNVGKIKGTGLGLSIVKKCVDLHQSQITVESQFGIGTTFIVKLPLVN